jgi:universal stress protein A
MNETKSRDSKPFTIVAGVDYSELSEEVLGQVVSAARAHERTRVHVIHVLGAPGTATHVGTVVAPDLTVESERLRAYVEQILLRESESREDEEKPPIELLTTHIGLYGAAEAISVLAAEVEAQLVIVGMRGKSGVKHLLLGSVAEATVRQAPCPVLVVRPMGATNPTIEAPCSRCLDARETTDGKEVWCEQHREQHGRRHTYRLGNERSSHQSGLLFRV